MEIPPITVAVESAIHDALKATVQIIADKYEIQVLNVSIEWINESDHCGLRYLVRKMETRTSKSYGA